MIVIDAGNYESEVVASKLPMVVDVWGPKCRPCLTLMPQIEKMSGAYAGKVRFGKINSAENRRLCISLKVLGLPTILFFADGEEKERLTGEVTMEAVRAATERLLSPEDTGGD